METNQAPRVDGAHENAAGSLLLWRAEALAASFEKRAKNAEDTRNKLIESGQHNHVAEEIFADRAATLWQCAYELRREMELPNGRQPEEKIADQRRSPE